MTFDPKRAQTREIAHRIQIEGRIVRKLVRSAIAAGFIVGHDYGDGPNYFANESHAMSSLGEVDDETLLLRKDGKVVGWVQLVYGNDGWDVISDYTVNLEDLIKPINEYSDKLAGWR